MNNNGNQVSNLSNALRQVNIGNRNKQPLEGYTLFSHRSAPNGFKVAIVLSELGFHYNTIFLDFNLGEHRAPRICVCEP
ncbi:CMF_collapsed_G0045420.mRNA.1.CDS.1 [Saccharomyces cerevisiae]|nr:CMF_collapsed_G0045420.mRNA.1.CDS.1 [Saccharomyces cerevisiae]